MNQRSAWINIAVLRESTKLSKSPVMSLVAKHPTRATFGSLPAMPSAAEKGREGLIAVVDSPVIVPPFCGRTRLDVITIGRGRDLLMEIYILPEKRLSSP